WDVQGRAARTHRQRPEPAPTNDSHEAAPARPPRTAVAPRRHHPHDDTGRSPPLQTTVATYGADLRPAIVSGGHTPAICLRAPPTGTTPFFLPGRWTRPPAM